MISSFEYNILKKLISDPAFGVACEDKNPDSIRALVRDKYIAPSGLREGKKVIYYTGYSVTEIGIRAIEEYEFRVSEKANSDKSLKLAKRANVISILAIIVSAIATAAAIIVSLFVSQVSS